MQANISFHVCLSGTIFFFYVWEVLTYSIIGVCLIYITYSIQSLYFCPLFINREVVLIKHILLLIWTQTFLSHQIFQS